MTTAARTDGWTEAELADLQQTVAAEIAVMSGQQDKPLLHLCVDADGYNAAVRSLREGGRPAVLADLQRTVDAEIESTGGHPATAKPVYHLRVNGGRWEGSQTGWASAFAAMERRPAPQPDPFTALANSILDLQIAVVQAVAGAIMPDPAEDIPWLPRWVVLTAWGALGWLRWPARGLRIWWRCWWR